MPTVNVHGLRIHWETQGLVADPAQRLFANFAALSGAGVPDLDLRIAPSTAPPDEAGWVPAFFQGNVRGFTRPVGGEFRLVAPAAHVLISADGLSIEARVEPAALNERGFANTTLFIALAIALRQRDLFHLHAGAVIRGDGERALVMGDSGAGKSTVTLALLDAGSKHLGDDAVFLTERDGEPTLLAFPRPFHLGPATLAAFPRLTGTMRDGNGKSDVAQDTLPGERIDRMGAPDVVLFPVVTGEAVTRVSQIPAADAFGHALRSSALVAVDGLVHKERQLALLGRVLAKARAFELHLGADWLADPAAAAARLPWNGGAERCPRPVRAPC